MISAKKLPPSMWVPVCSDPKLAADAEALALKIAGEGAPAHILALARDSAQARIDLSRVHQVRHELSRGCRGSLSFMDFVFAAKLTRVKSPERSMILAIDRYERRAFSRMMKTYRAFNAAVCREKSRRRGY